MVHLRDDLNRLPETVSWEQIDRFLQSIGIDSRTLMQTGLHINQDAVESTVYAKNAKGVFYLTTDSETGEHVPATHRIHIPITFDGQPRHVVRCTCDNCPIHGEAQATSTAS